MALLTEKAPLKLLGGFLMLSIFQFTRMGWRKNEGWFPALHIYNAVHESFCRPLMFIFASSSYFIDSNRCFFFAITSEFRT
jgi:hypothetical protein